MVLNHGKNLLADIITEAICSEELKDIQPEKRCFATGIEVRYNKRISSYIEKIKEETKEETQE